MEIIHYEQYIQQNGTNTDKNHFQHIKQLLNPIDKLLEPDGLIDNMSYSYHYIVPKFMALIDLQKESHHRINELLTLNMILRIFNVNKSFVLKHKIILDTIFNKVNEFIPKLTTILSQDHDNIIIELCYETLQQCNIAKDICYSGKDIA
jgi:hypothetical protein